MSHCYRKEQMKFVYHHTGDYVRNNADTAASRTPAYVEAYDSLEDIPNLHVRQVFDWMMQTGEIVTSSGADVYQIRMGDAA
jgi:hypothetical protein